MPRVTAPVATSAVRVFVMRMKLGAVLVDPVELGQAVAVARKPQAARVQAALGQTRSAPLAGTLHLEPELPEVVLALDRKAPPYSWKRLGETVLSRSQSGRGHPHELLELTLGQKRAPRGVLLLAQVPQGLVQDGAGPSRWWQAAAEGHDHFEQSKPSRPHRSAQGLVAKAGKGTCVASGSRAGRSSRTTRSGALLTRRNWNTAARCPARTPAWARQPANPLGGELSAGQRFRRGVAGPAADG